MDTQSACRSDLDQRLSASDDKNPAKAATILLVEDEGFVREVACEVLRSAGYRVLAAKNAVEAERQYLRSCGEVNLLLTDVILPGESGRSLASRLRLANPGLRVLLVTGYAEQMEFQAAEGEECLPKPFSTGELLRWVREMIDHGEFGASQVEDRITPACGSGSLA